MKVYLVPDGQIGLRVSCDCLHFTCTVCKLLVFSSSRSSWIYRWSILLVYGKRWGRWQCGGAREEGDLGLVEQTLSGGLRSLRLRPCQSPVGSVAGFKGLRPAADL